MKSFSVENYRAFASRADICIRPLTLLFGFNSAGKSALLRWLPLLRDSLDSTSQPLNLGAVSMRGAAFDNILSRFSSGRALSFEVKGDSGRVHHVIRDLPDKRKRVVEVYEVEREGQFGRLEWLALDDQPNAYKLTTNGIPELVEVTFSGLFPVASQHKRNNDYAVRDLTIEGMKLIGTEILKNEIGNTYWLQANRAVPPRKEVVSGSLGSIHPDGSGITEFLYEEYYNGSDIIEELSKWYKTATGYTMTVKRGAFLDSDLYSFGLEAAGSFIELADTGEGMGQVLPILGLLMLAERGRLGEKPTLLLEHPELHLHSAAEPALANLLCSVAASGTANIVAETHSESFLLALQLAVIEGRLSPQDVAVYWVRQTDGLAATVNEITFDEGGRPTGGAWPPGVFDEKAEQARKVVLARRAQIKNAN